MLRVKEASERAERVLDNNPKPQQPDGDTVTWRDMRLELRALRAELRLLLVIGIFANTILAGLHLPEILTGAAVATYFARSMWLRNH